jgi:hypothetical protein
VPIERDVEVAYFLFVDESGSDLRETPCEVLAGIAVQDGKLWSLIEAIKEAEQGAFATRYRREHGELKGKKTLKRKVFRHASQLPEFPADERRRLAAECLAAGPNPTKAQLTALAQAKLAFVREVFCIARRFGCAAFASVVLPSAPRPVRDVLRKDYAFLFQRFFYFLEDSGGDSQGAVVFDELERSRAHMLIGQMEEYFLNTRNGRERSTRVIPEPFFVHSDLTSLVQIADLIAYVIAWGFRLPRFQEVPSRPELLPFVEDLIPLRYSTMRPIQGRRHQFWGFAVIDDLRGWEDRMEEDA